MAKILFAWELGGGVGHLVKIRTLALALHRRGHELYFAVKDLDSALRVLHDVPIAGVFAAPLVARRLPGPPQPTECYPEILLQDGYGDVGRISGALRAWQSLIQLIQPQAIICEHAPGAMLAVHALRLPYVLLGTGFTCPRIEHGQWPVFGTRRRTDHRPCAASLDQAWNDSLRQCGLPSIESAAHVVTGARDMILACIPELDPFGPRANSMYWGNWTIAEEGMTCEWPSVSGPRVFAYLKARPETNRIIALLAELGWPTVMHLGSNPALKAARWPRNIVLSQQPVSMSQMCREGRRDVAEWDTRDDGHCFAGRRANVARPDLS